MKRILLAVFLLTAALRAEAIDWTDIWYNKLQPGYGYNFVQSDDCLFVTFYVYGADGNPTWFGGCLTWNGVDSYTGTIYTTTGTFFGAPWDPARWIVSGGPGSTATFTPSTVNNYQGTFSYTLAGVGSAPAHPIERETLSVIATGGNYSGAQTGAYSGCSDPNGNYSYLAYLDLVVTHLATGSATFDFDYGGGLTCTFTGTYQQNGQYYLIDNASYTCADGLNTTAQLSEIKATALGIEGRLSANVPYYGTGCVEDATFSAVFKGG